MRVAIFPSGMLRVPGLLVADDLIAVAFEDDPKRSHR
jgi:hypothetical protein